MFDRVSLKVSGSISYADAASLAAYAEGIGSPSSLLGRPRMSGKRWQYAERSGDASTISRCRLALWYSEGLPAQFSLELTVNPTRTLAHLLDAHSYAELASLTPRAFFTAQPSPAAAEITLDGRDNMVADFRAFSGTMAQTRLQRVADFLTLFERNLLSLVLEEICPAALGFEETGAEAGPCRRSEALQVSLRWADLTVSQAEVCWEWYEPEAVSQAHALAEMAFLSARSTDISFFPLAGVARELGSPSVRIPLSKGIDLAIYAKARERLRFEVRYKTKLGEKLRSRPRPRPHSLASWFDLIREDAHLRVPWQRLDDALSVSHKPHTDLLADLLDGVAAAARTNAQVRRDLLLNLLRHGGVTSTGPKGAFPEAVMKRLAATGVVEHVRLVPRDASKGRRYSLARRFQSLSKV
ncbi:hypothetical protein ACQKO5_14755 [Novosphingobium subterraneum]|uniref:hypothetical protein n=1 Tax=Novosphingobium subterraneum TaxID=48936 RepID=UPI003CFBD1EE